MKKFIKLGISILLLVVVARLVIWSAKTLIPIVLAAAILYMVYRFFQKKYNN